MILQWLATPEWARLVAALLHTLWQGAMLAVLLGLILRRCQHPAWRYRWSLAALGGVVLSGLVTWAVLAHPAAPTAAPTAVSAPPAAATSPADDGQPASVRHFPPLPAKATAANWTAWLAFVWLLGAAVMLGRAGAQVAGAERLRRSCQPVADTQLTGLLEEARHALRMTRRVRLAVTNQLTSPAVAGVLVPTLILPLSLTTLLSPEQIRMVLLHELAHIRRGDYLANLGQLFAESLLFFNPAVWWLSRQIRVEREACCDATAIALSGPPADYARTLLCVAESLLQPPPAAAPAFGRSRPPSTLLERVQRLLVPGYRPTLRLTWRAMLLAMLTGGGLLFLCALGTRTAVAAILSPQERIARLEQKMAELGEKPEDAIFQGYDEQTPKVLLTGTVRAADGTPLPQWLYLSTSSAKPRATYGSSIAVQNGLFSNTIPQGTLWLWLEPANFAPCVLGPLDGLATNRFDHLELVLERGFDVPVQFADADSGAPVPDVRFNSHYWIDYMGLPTHSWIAGTDGRATLTHCANLPVVLNVNAPGYEIVERRFDGLTAGQPLKVALHRGAVVHGTVVDKTTGAPIPGATVRMLYEKGATEMRYDWNDTLPQLAVTDEHGRFTANQFSPQGRYWLGVSAPGHESVVLESLLPSGQTVTARLGPELVVRGRVMGSLVELLKVRTNRVLDFHYTEKYDNSSYGNFQQIPVTLTGGVARFQFTNRVAGEVAVDVGPRSSFRLLVTAPVADWVIDLTSNHPAASLPVVKRTVIYRFQHPSGIAPRGTVEVEVPDNLNPAHLTAHTVELVITNGEVRVDIPVGGRTFVNPKHTVGYWFKTDYAGRLIGPGDGPVVIDLPVVPAGAIYARAKNADGTPAGGLFFSVEELKRSPLRDDQNALSDGSDSVSGDAPRRWVSGPLPLGGTYQIIGWRKNAFCASKPIKLTESQPDAEVTLQFPPPLSFTGAVVDAHGQPVRGSAVGLEFRTASGHRFSLESVYSDEQGQFAMDGVTPALGIYSVNVTVPGMRAESRDVDFSRLPLTLRLEPGRRLSGQVIEAATGYVIPNAEIRAWVADDSTRWPQQSVRTDADGRFDFNTLADATYQVYVDGAMNYGGNFEAKFKPGQTNLLLKVTPYTGSDLKPKAPATAAAPTNAPANPNRLISRVFKINPQAILDTLRRAGTNVDEVKFNNPSFPELCRGWFTASGLNLDSPQSVFFNNQRGLLYVRATPADLDVIAQLLPADANVPPQVHLKARFLELPAGALTGVTLYETNLSGQITGFLTDSQVRALLKRWQKLAGAETLAEPECVTTSGRQTRMKATQLQTVIVGVKPAALTLPGVIGAAATNYLEMEPMEFGPQFDVVPRVLADGYTLNLFMTASVNEFLSYDDHSRTNEVTVYLNGEPKLVPVPIPLIWQRQIRAKVTLWDNQSVILAHLPATMTPPADEYFAGKQKILPPAHADKKQLVILVTASLVDPAGNRLHPDAEMPFAQNGPPPQPKP